MKHADFTNTNLEFHNRAKQSNMVTPAAVKIVIQAARQDMLWILVPNTRANIETGTAQLRVKPNLEPGGYTKGDLFGVVSILEN